MAEPLLFRAIRDVPPDWQAALERLGPPFGVGARRNEVRCAVTPQSRPMHLAEFARPGRAAAHSTPVLVLVAVVVASMPFVFHQGQVVEAVVVADAVTVVNLPPSRDRAAVGSLPDMAMLEDLVTVYGNEPVAFDDGSGALRPPHQLGRVTVTAPPLVMHVAPAVSIGHPVASKDGA